MFSIQPFIILRLYGGLGNQLFSYAAAFRLAHFNKIPLYIDSSSGFERDHVYKRKFQLNAFCITAPTSVWANLFGKTINFFRLFGKKLNLSWSFTEHFLISQHQISFDQHLLSLKIQHPVLFEGFWQSELYFKDATSMIREQFQFKSDYTISDFPILSTIDFDHAVAIHIRHFNDLYHPSKGNVSDAYYHQAIQYYKKLNPHFRFYLFSDRPASAKHKYFATDTTVILVHDIIPQTNELKELYFMTQFRYFITANSTYSWWGAWLSQQPNKIVIAPGEIIDSGEGMWGFDGLIPDEWIKM